MRFQQKPFSHDVRSNDFLSGRFYGAVTDLKPTLNRPRITPLNQGDTLECAEHAAVHNCKLMFGFDASKDWQVNKVGRLMGRPVSVSGSDPNATMDSQMYFKDGGYLPIGKWNPALPQSCDLIAKDTSCVAYIKPSLGKDAFDSVCMELQRHYNFDTHLGAAVQAFTSWYSSFGGTEITMIDDTSFGAIRKQHASIIKSLWVFLFRKAGALLGYHSYLWPDFDRTDPDENKHFLWLLNSYGTTIGDGGYQKMYRPVVNQLMAQWGTSMKIVTPLTPERAQQAKDQSQYGLIERLIINFWYKLTLIALSLYGRVTS